MARSLAVAAQLKVFILFFAEKKFVDTKAERTTYFMIIVFNNYILCMACADVGMPSLLFSGGR